VLLDDKDMTILITDEFHTTWSVVAETTEEALGCSPTVDGEQRRDAHLRDNHSTRLTLMQG